MAISESTKLGIKAKLRLGTPPKEVAELFDVKEPTVYAIHQKLKKEQANETVNELRDIPIEIVSHVVEAAKKYPQSSFVIVDTELSEVQENALSILFDVDEASFPLGYLSAWWADTHDTDPKLGYVGAMYIPQIRQFIEPFNSGANRYNIQYGKNVDTIGAYANDFFNEDLGKHMSDSLIGLGADVIFGVGSETGNGSLLKAYELGKVGIGTDVDQYYSFPEVSDILLSSAMKGLDNAIYEVIKSFINGAFIGGSIYNGKLVNFGVGTAPYHNYESHIPDSINIEIDKIKAGIIDGSISTTW